MTLSPKIKGLIIGAAFLLAAIIVAVVVLVVRQKTNVVKVQSITFQVANENMLVGEEKKVSVTIYPNNAANKKVQYSSTNSSIVEIVAVNGDNVTIRAKAIGEADIVVRSLANKKLSDSCHVSVTDVVANEINVQASSSSSVGEQAVVPIILEPQNANYQKLTVVSYDNTQIKDPVIVQTENGAQLRYTAIASGTSQLVLGVYAENGKGNSIVLTKQIEIITTAPVVADLSFVVKSNNNQEYSVQQPKFLVDEGDVLTFMFTYEYENGESGTASAINITCNENIFTYQKVGAEYSITTISNSWTLADIVFEYGGYSKTLTFVQGTIPHSFDTELLDSALEKGYSARGYIWYDLKMGKNYKIDVSDEVAKLIEHGFAHLELDAEYSEISLDGYVLTCNESVSELDVGLVLVIDYWDSVIPDLQNDFTVTINSGYIEI